jgi:hypothetical protein
MQNGKGSKSRITNKPQFDEHFDDIDWRDTKSYCYNCNRDFESGEEKYLKDGRYFHLKTCPETNWN